MMILTSQFGRSGLDELRALGLFLNALVHHLQRGFACKRNIAGDHFVQNQAVGIQIRAAVRRLAFDLLGRHVTRRAQKRAGPGHPDRAFLERFRQPEIAHEDLVVLIHQEVLRLQIAMDHAFGVRSSQRFGDLLRKLQDALQRHLRIVANDVLQILAFDERHGNEAETADIAHVVDTQDVLMGNLAGENQLLLEALQRIRLADGSVAHDFDGYGAVQVFIVGLINSAHAALAEKSFDAVTRTEIAPRSDDGGIHHLNCFGLPQWHRSPAA